MAARQAKRELLLALVDLAAGFDPALVHVDESPESVAPAQRTSRSTVALARASIRGRSSESGGARRTGRS